MYVIKKKKYCEFAPWSVGLLVLRLWARPGAYPKGEHHSMLLSYWQTMDKAARLGMDKHTSLVAPFISYNEKWHLESLPFLVTYEWAP